MRNAWLPIRRGSSLRPSFGTNAPSAAIVLASTGPNSASAREQRLERGGYLVVRQEFAGASDRHAHSLDPVGDARRSLAHQPAGCGIAIQMRVERTEEAEVGQRRPRSQQKRMRFEMPIEV